MEKYRYWVWYEWRTGFTCYGPYTLEQAIRVSEFPDDDRAYIYEFDQGEWYFIPYDWRNVTRQGPLPKTSDRIIEFEKAMAGRRSMESKFYVAVSNEDESQVVCSGPFTIQDTFPVIDEAYRAHKEPHVLEFDCGKWYWYGMDRPTVGDRREVGSYFQKEIEALEKYIAQKGASQWEEETVVPQANTKACSTSTTKTCTYMHLAVRQPGKNRN